MGAEAAVKSIGLLGGTFDPVHLGHLRAAEEVREIFSLDWIELLPAKRPPHKTDRPLSDVTDRLAMLELVVEDNPFFRISNEEVQRGGVSYLLDTLRVYRDQEYHPTSLFFIMGMDSFIEISTWHQYEDLFSLSQFIVISRPGFERPPIGEVVSEQVRGFFREGEEKGCPFLEHKSGTRIYFPETTMLDISATGLRARIGRRESVRYLVPENVCKYIEKKGLYRNLRGA